MVTLNPVLATSAIDRYVNKYLFSPLIALDERLQPVPALAKDWNVSANGLTYVFELDERATFSDGRPVRARDVIFTLNRIADPNVHAPLVADAFVHLKSTRAIDDRTVEVVFGKRFGAQLVRFADVYVVPEHHYGTGHFANDFNDTALGSGPYLVVRREQHQIVVERRRTYWHQPPHIQRVVFQTITEPQTAWDAIQRGDIDETMLTADIWHREHDKASATLGFRAFYALNYQYVVWNHQRALFADKRVRRALAMCVPVPGIVKNIFHNTARPVSGPFTPDEDACNPDVKPVPHDIPAAQQLLATVGWSDHDHDGTLDRDGEPFKFTLLVMNIQAMQDLGVMIRSELGKIGIRVEVQPVDAPTLLQYVRAGNYDAAYYSWTLDADPDPYSIFHSSQFPPNGQNFAFYRNAVADRLIEEARQELDADKRRALYWRLHEVLAEDQPYAWTIQVATKWAYRRRLHGVEISPAYGLYLWYPGELAWWVTSEK